jgi:hypothetical protein
MNKVSAAVLFLLCGTLALPACLSAQLQTRDSHDPYSHDPYTVSANLNPYQIPEGSTFLVRLNDKLQSNNATDGKRFTAKLSEDLVTPNGLRIRRGKKIHGHISSVSSGFHGRMLLSFTEIETDHGWMPLVATVVGVPGEHGVHTDEREGEIERNGVDKRRAIESAAAGAAIGAAAGAVGGGGKGAGIGAGAGAALGTTAGILSDRNLRLEKGTEIELRLDRPLTVPQN